MTMSLLYVSTCLIRLPDEGREVDQIVRVARARNADLAVTGALVFTRKHFAQVLEGSSDAVEELMGNIVNDRRHTNVNVVEASPIGQRRFAHWSMAYAGPSTYVQRHIVPLLPRLQDAQKRAEHVVRLISLMQQLSQGES